MAPDRVAQALGVVPSAGLIGAQVHERLARFGPNTLPESRAPSVAILAARQLLSFIVVLLLLAALVSFALGERADSVAMLVAVMLNVMVGFVMGFRAERALASLQALSAPSARIRPRRPADAARRSRAGARRHRPLQSG